MDYVPGQRPDLRVSDAERDAVMAELGSHLETGRLDLDEYGQRLEAAAAARTHGDLDRLLADLPRPASPAQGPPQRPRSRFPASGAVVAAVFAALVVAAVSSSFWNWHAHSHGHWGWGAWWLIVIPILLLRRLLWRGPRRGPR
jgi:hypothetical protein